MHMKILKRNQIIISVIALMLITVGYMNYSSSISKAKEANSNAIDGVETAGIGDARLVNSENATEIIEENDSTEEQQTFKGESQNEEQNSNTKNNNTAQSSVAEQASSNSFSDISNATNYFASSRIQRDNMYSEMLETYEKMLASETVPNEQKANSTNEIVNINSKKNSIMIAENLIKNLGFEDVVIFMNNNSVSVIVKAETLQEADVAQIQNIVCRELGVSAEVVHISVR